MKRQTLITQETKLPANFYEAIAAIKNAHEAEMFLGDLCTPAELEAMSDRWRVVPLLKAEKSYQKIHEETGVSVTTVGRVARTLMLGSGGYQLIYARLGAKG